LVACAGPDEEHQELDSGLIISPDAASASDASQTGDAGTAEGGAGSPDAGALNTPDAARPLTDSAVPDGATSQRDAAPAGNDAGVTLDKFSFFVTSLSAMRQLSGSPNGFGGNLSFGEAGQGAGLRGADKICTAVAELSMPGSAAKQWRAFLSTSTVHAKDRIGTGPWYDRAGRVVAMNLQALLTGNRPQGIDPLIAEDLPNERGEPNQAGSAEGGDDDNHDTVTATNARGEYDGTPTCGDWTTTTTTGSGRQSGPRVGHSWAFATTFSGQSWISTHQAPGCGASVNLVQNGGGSGTGIGNGGGYGGIYCFALMP
jgi:hypothetical protein